MHILILHLACEFRNLVFLTGPNGKAIKDEDPDIANLIAAKFMNISDNTIVFRYALTNHYNKVSASLPDVRTYEAINVSMFNSFNLYVKYIN